MEGNPTMNIRDFDTTIYCAGPARTVGAVVDTAAKDPKYPWINNPYKPSMEFCPHGSQTSHPVQAKKRGKK